MNDLICMKFYSTSMVLIPGGRGGGRTIKMNDLSDSENGNVKNQKNNSCHQSNVN